MALAVNFGHKIITLLTRKGDGSVQDSTRGEFITRRRPYVGPWLLRVCMCAQHQIALGRSGAQSYAPSEMAVTRADVQIAIDNLLQLAGAEGSHNHPRMLFSEVADAFTASVRDPMDLSAGVRRSDRHYTRKLCNHFDCFIDEISDADIASFLVSTLGGPAESRRRCIAHLRGIIGFAKDLGLKVPKLPKLPRQKKKLHKRALSMPDLKKLLSAIRSTASEHIYDCVVLMSLTGMRVSEACGLMCDDFDGDGKRILIRQAKTGPRWVSLGEAACSIIISRLGDKCDGLYVFRSGYGPKPSARSVRFAFVRACKTTGMRGVTPHVLRHTYATAALSSGVPVNIVSSMLGHASPAITMGIYAHSIRTDVHSATATLDSYISGEISKGGGSDE